MATQEEKEFSQDSVFSFWKVEDFFNGHKNWNFLESVSSYVYHDDKKSLEINAIGKLDKAPYVLEIQFWSDTVFRVRFDPGVKKYSDYPIKRSRAVVKTQQKNLKIQFAETKDSVNTAYLDTSRVRVKIDTSDKLRIYTYWKIPAGLSLLFQTSNLLFTPNGDKDWHVIQSVYKPPTARYIGFGEQGGQHLIKNEEQVTFFNYDNMRYRQVYNRGPLEPREPMYHSEPFFIEFNGVPSQTHLYGLFIDNPGQVLMDIGWEHSEHLLLGTRFGGIDYYLITAEHVRFITMEYSALIGTAHLKPRYALGFHQGCYGYDTQAKVEKVAELYRKVHHIPLDAIHIDVDIQKGYHTFTIDKSNFPTPDVMFKNLRDAGIKCSTNITPIISNQDYDGDYTTYQEGAEKGYFVLDKRNTDENHKSKYGQYQDFPSDNTPDDREGNINSGRPYIGEVYYGGDRGTTGHYPNFAKREVREWWGKQYKYLFEQGLEFVWQDMTTPAIRPSRGDMRSFPFRLLLDNNWLSGRDDPTEDEKTEAIKIWNLYSYNLHQSTYRGLQALPGRENIRPFIIGRGAFAGVHRYAGLWNGDNSSSWDFFQMNVYQCLALGLCSMSVNGQDIGGFEPDSDGQKWVDPQLLIRWTAAGAFLPWFRNHYNAKGSKLFQEPYAYQGINLDEAGVPENYRHFYQAVYPACQYYIMLRYRLMQLFYDALFENQFDGLPISRALILNDCDRTLFSDKARFLSDEFFVREDLLICPILEPESVNGGRRDIYFPTNNNWYQFVDNRARLPARVRGGNTIRGYDASISPDYGHIPYIVPMFVRGGAILPTLEQEFYVGERNANGLANPITFNIYPGALRTMHYKLYLDDGISRDSAPDVKDAEEAEAARRKAGTAGPGETGYNFDAQRILEQNCTFPQNPDAAAKAKYRRTLITNHYLNTGDVLVTFDREHDNYTPQYEKFFFIALIHDVKTPDDPLVNITIQRDGAEQSNPPKIQEGDTQATADAFYRSDVDAWYYNPNIHITFVKVFDNATKIAVSGLRAHG